MTKDILFGFLSHASSALRRSCYACWGHPKPRQNMQRLRLAFCEHALQRGFFFKFFIMELLEIRDKKLEINVLVYN